MKNCGKMFGFPKFGHLRKQENEAKTEHKIIIIEIPMAFKMVCLLFCLLRNLNAHLKCSNSFLWANCCSSSFTTVTTQFLRICKAAIAREKRILGDFFSNNWDILIDQPGQGTKLHFPVKISVTTPRFGFTAINTV